MKSDNKITIELRLVSFTQRYTMKTHYNTVFSIILSLIMGLNTIAADIVIAPLEINVPELDFHIEKVIVSQPEKIVVGFVYDEYGRRGIDLGNYIEVSLNEYLTTKIPPKEGSKPMILRINKLVMTGSSSVNYTELGVSFVEQFDTNYVAHLHTGTITQRKLDKKEINHPIYRGQNLIQAIELCFMDYAKREEKKQLLNLTLTKEQLYSAPVFNYKNYPVLDEQSRTAGIIHTYSDFLYQDIDNTINQFTIIPLEESVTQNDPVRIEFATPPPQLHWGISDGNRFYRKIGDFYHPIEFKYNSLQLRNYRSYMRFEQNESLDFVAAITPFFGLLGFIVAVAIESSDHPTSFTFEDLETEQIDYLTGSISPLTEKSDIILEMNMRSSTESLCIYNRGEKIGCIKNKEYIRFRPAINESIVHLTAIPENGTRKIQIRFNPNHHQRFNFYFRKDKLMFVDKGIVYLFELNEYLMNLDEVERETLIKK